MTRHGGETWVFRVQLPADVPNAGRYAAVVLTALRRAVEAAYRQGMTPNRRLGKHFRMVHSHDFAAVATVLSGWGYQVQMPSGEVVDRTGDVLDKLAMRPEPRSAAEEEIESLRRRIAALEKKGATECPS